MYICNEQVGGVAYSASGGGGDSGGGVWVRVLPLCEISGIKSDCCDHNGIRGSALCTARACACSAPSATTLTPPPAPPTRRHHHHRHGRCLSALTAHSARRVRRITTRETTTRCGSPQVRRSASFVNFTNTYIYVLVLLLLPAAESRELLNSS